MILKFKSNDEFLELLKKINEKYYECLNANILYLEELEDKIYINYLLELRDAYSHLVRVLGGDLFSPKNKKNVLNHLRMYVSHLQNGLLNSFQKIISLEIKSIKKCLSRNNVKLVEYQIALKAHQLRIMSNDISIDKKIDRYKSLLFYISDIRKKFHLE